MISKYKWGRERFLDVCREGHGSDVWEEAQGSGNKQPQPAVAMSMKSSQLCLFAVSLQEQES